MPPDGYQSVSIPDATHERLDELAGDDESIADVIVRLVDDHDDVVLPNATPDDVLTAADFDSRMDEFRGRVVTDTADELERRFS